MFKNTFFMGITTAAKMLSGIFVFVLMARFLGPHDFGMVAYSFTLASLFVLIVDYGFSQQLLRDIGAAPKQVHVLMGRVLAAKVVLSAIMVFFCFIYLRLFPKDHIAATVLLLLLASSVLASFSEFLNVGFRGVGNFKQETNIATLGAIIHFIILVATMIIKPNVIWIAYAFVVSRIIYLFISWHAYHRYIGNIQLTSSQVQVISTLKSGFPYAADAGFTNFFQQVDTLIVNHYLGVSGVGLYQAATKWLQGAMQFAPVLANVYLPKLAEDAENRNINVRLAEKLNLKLLLIGATGWAFFSFFGSYLSDFIYGEAFKDISLLWPSIGLLMLIRYVAASQGVLLVAYGKQKIRVVTQIVSLAVFILASISLIKWLGLVGMILALSITYMTTFLIYMFSLLKYKIPTGYTRTTIFFNFVLLISAAYLSFISLIKLAK